MSPDHYSREIPGRCEQLLRQLLPVVDGAAASPGQSLRTTLLLAMATPMIVLPVERLAKRARYGDPGVANDLELDSELGDRVAEVLKAGRPFRDAPFFVPEHWSYVPAEKPFNVAGSWRGGLLEELATPEAFARAGDTDAWTVITDLRNALAHGGISYLSQDGRHTVGEVAVFAFAGAKMKGHDLTELNILRIHQDHFRTFLSAWADWLAGAGVVAALDQEIRLVA